MPRRPLLSLLLVAALTAAVVPTTTGYAAARRPDLVVSGLAAKSWSVQAGAVLTARVTTKNIGRAAAGSSWSRVYLSTDARVGRDLVQRAVLVKRLPRGSRQSLLVRLRVPATARARTYRLIACADVTKRVRESDERNNCRVATRRVTVTAPPPPPPPPPPPTFPLDPDPVSASDVVLEPAAATTQLVDPADPSSLTMQTTASDGTVYRLVFPAESLLTPEEITMTPLAGATLPILTGGFRAGVKLEPEGLMLQAPAVLTISGAALGPVAEQTPYVFHEDGEDFHQHSIAAPLAEDGPDVVRLPLTHFSVAGVGGGTSADRADLAAHPPVRTQAQLQSTIAGLINEVRNGGEWAADRAQAAVHSYYDNVVDPVLAAAESDPSLAPGATAEALGLLYQLELLGEEDGPVHQRIRERLHTIWTNAAEHWWNRCSQHHELRAISLLGGVARQLALLGFSEADQAKALEYARRCSQFEVELDSGLGWLRDHRPTANTRIQDSASFRLQSTTQVPADKAGTSTLDYTEASLTSNQTTTDDSCTCVITATLTGTTPGAIRADVLERANPIDLGPGTVPAPPAPRLQLDPGVGAGGASAPPTEHYHQESTPLGGSRDYDQTFWLNNMLTWSHGWPLQWNYELDPAPGSEVMLAETIEGTYGTPEAATGQLSTRTTIRVTHTPETG